MPSRSEPRLNIVPPGGELVSPGEFLRDALVESRTPTRLAEQSA